eukprot:c40393_g1_i1 orf=2-181(-)
MLCRGSLAINLHIDNCEDIQIQGLPQLFPFRIDPKGEYHTHVVLSHQIHDASEILRITGD